MRPGAFPYRMARNRRARIASQEAARLNRMASRVRRSDHSSTYLPKERTRTMRAILFGSVAFAAALVVQQPAQAQCTIAVFDDPNYVDTVGGSTSEVGHHPSVADESRAHGRSVHRDRCRGLPRRGRHQRLPPDPRAGDRRSGSRDFARRGRRDRRLRCGGRRHHRDGGAPTSSTSVRAVLHERRVRVLAHEHGLRSPPAPATSTPPTPLAPPSRGGRLPCPTSAARIPSRLDYRRGRSRCTRHPWARRMRSCPSGQAR